MTNYRVISKHNGDSDLMKLVELSRLSTCLKLPEQVVTALTLHAFTNASEKAYAATVYSLHESPDGRGLLHRNHDC
jgi:hypothetical protein